MSTLKDRKPVSAGFRSFLKRKFYLFAIVAASVAAFLWYAGGLVVSLNPEGGREPMYFASSKGDVWNIQFTHSVERSLVEEFFVVNGPDDLTMTHTRFESFGWGFPYSASDGVIKETGNGRYELKMDRPYRTVKLRVAVQARQCIVHGDDIYDLCDMFGHGTMIEVKAQYRCQYWLDNYF